MPPLFGPFQAARADPRRSGLTDRPMGKGRGMRKADRGTGPQSAVLRGSVGPTAQAT
jgi:hypothetical protein